MEAAFGFHFFPGDEHSDGNCSKPTPENPAARHFFKRVPSTTLLAAWASQSADSSNLKWQSHGTRGVCTILDASAHETRARDVIPDEYEGGLKLWESSLDLLEVLRTEIELNLQNKRVLDLGCGHGVLGMWAVERGAEKVCFQDLNKETLVKQTFPNLVKNLEQSPEEIAQNHEFIAGDWKECILGIDARAFDLILTSETVYSESNFAILRDLFMKVLKPEGEVLLSGKRYYFGVGGGTEAFALFLGSNFKTEVLKTFENGSSNVRDILKIRNADFI